MALIEGVCKEVIDKSEWVAIATAGKEGPHLVATWGDYVQTLDASGETFVIPAGRMQETERNISADNRIELLFASRQVQGSRSPGQGCCVSGTAEFQYAGAAMEKLKSRFPWARAALVVTVTSAKTQL